MKSPPWFAYAAMAAILALLLPAAGCKKNASAEPAGNPSVTIMQPTPTWGGDTLPTGESPTDGSGGNDPPRPGPTTIHSLLLPEPTQTPSSPTDSSPGPERTSSEPGEPGGTPEEATS